MLAHDDFQVIIGTLTTSAQTRNEVSLFDYGNREGEIIFRHFGNSPAFVMFTLGNELGMNDGMDELVAHFKKTNLCALQAQGSNNMQSYPIWVYPAEIDPPPPMASTYPVASPTRKPKPTSRTAAASCSSPNSTHSPTACPARS